MAKVKCHGCGRTITELTGICPYCGKGVPGALKQLVRMPKSLVIAPWIIAVYAGAISVPTTVEAINRYSAATEARHIAEIRALEHEKAVAHAEEIRSARVRRDSVCDLYQKKG